MPSENSQSHFENGKTIVLHANGIISKIDVAKNIEGSCGVVYQKANMTEMFL